MVAQNQTQDQPIKNFAVLLTQIVKDNKNLEHIKFSQLVDYLIEKGRVEKAKEFEEKITALSGRSIPRKDRFFIGWRNRWFFNHLQLPLGKYATFLLGTDGGLKR
jgi:hypothetical protein